MEKVRDLKDFNISLLAKWWWKLKTDGNSLWSKVIRSIHSVTDFDDRKLAKNFYKGTWKNITEIEENFLEAGISLRDLFRRKVGRGEKTRFWKDVWIVGVPLKDKFPRIYKIESNKNSLIKDRVVVQPDSMVEMSWQWKKHRMSNAELNEFQLLTTLLNNFTFTHEDDSWEWIIGDNGKFSVKSLRQALDISKKYSIPKTLKWNSWIPCRVNCFSWRLVQYKIPLKVNLSNRGIRVADVNCSICGIEAEVVDHTFVSCDFAKKIWERIFD